MISSDGRIRRPTNADTWRNDAQNSYFEPRNQRYEYQLGRLKRGPCRDTDGDPEAELLKLRPSTDPNCSAFQLVLAQNACSTRHDHAFFLNETN
jgi:hypothetical protein